MNIHAQWCIIHRMDISLLTTTRDPEQLRTLAIAMVQKVKAENAGLLDRMRILEEQMKRSLQQRFGKKCESLIGLRCQSVIE